MNKIITLLMILCLPMMTFGQDAETLKKAQSGDVLAQWSLAFYYKTGREGVKKDNEKYVYWLKKAANNTDSSEEMRFYIASAQCDLGELYKDGNCGLPIDEEEYIRWMKKAASNGYGSACFSLGLYYEDFNTQEAIYWLKKCMDMKWEDYKEEYELASEHLRKLGVYYHPGDHTGHSDSGRSSSRQSYSDSGSSSSSRSSSASSAPQQQQHQSRQVMKERWRPCISCDPDRKGRCSNCHGRGGYYIGNIMNICVSCNGTGVCVWCQGRGEIKEVYTEWE